MDLRCKNLNLRGQTITVNGKTYAVPADGVVRDVAEEHAMKLLQNLSSWVPLDGPGVAKAEAPKAAPRADSKSKPKRRGRRTETAPEKPAETPAETEDEKPKKPGVISRLFGGSSEDSSDEDKE